MSTRGLTFGGAAEAYEQFRPDYPVELYELVTAYAGQPVRTALEIGAGTGKATRLFARHGVAVTATEPDGDMLAELRRRVPGGVTTVQASLEQLRPVCRYELVYAAASLHWTQSAGRWDRIAALVEPNGVFASFGGPVRVADAAVDAAVRAAHAPYLHTDEVPPPDRTPVESDLQWPGNELRRSAQFCDVQQHVVERRYTLPAADFVGYLSTVSAYLELPPAQRDLAFAAIRRSLPDTVGVNADLIVHLARRRPDE